MEVGVEVPARNSDDASDGKYVTRMLKHILEEIKFVKQEVKTVQDSTEHALNDFKADVKEPSQLLGAT